jgi:anti-sigma regulatory factor (Ser/Thr protein kinase)
MFYGALDLATGRLTFVSAGHNPLLVVRAATGQGEYLKSRGIPLGAIRGGAFAAALEEKSIDLAPGDVVVQFTDGVSEAFDSSGTEQFGLERLKSPAEEAAPRGSRAVIDAIRQSLSRWTSDSPAFDDETLVVLSRQKSRVPHGKDSDDQGWAACELVARARKVGQPVHLPASFEALAGLGEWISSCRDLRELSLSERTVLETALYEVCANIIEHGYGEDATQKLELQWVPADSSSEGNAAKELSERVREGMFVIVDRGAPFVADTAGDVDFNDPAVRKRGRGLGLEIIRGAMDEVTMIPETAEGNVTVLRFDPAKVRAEEVHHVS